MPNQRKPYGGYLSLRQLRMFHEVARLGSFTAAAKCLAVSQPAISLQIHTLEKGLLQQLGHWENRRYVLSEAGHVLQSYAERILLLTSDLERALEGLRNTGGSSLRIATTKLIASYSQMLPVLAEALKTLHKETTVRLEIGTNAWAIEDVLAGRSDFGIVVNSSSDALVKTTIFEDVLVLILPKGHKAAGRSSKAFRFEEETLILREPGSKTREIVEDALKKRQIRPRQTMEVGDAEAIKSAVSAGLGVSVITAMAVEKEIRSGTLVAIPFLDGDRLMHFEVIHRRGQSTPVMQSFLDAISSLDRRSR